MIKFKRPSKYKIIRGLTNVLRSYLNFISRIDYLVSPQENLIQDYTSNVTAEKIVVYVCYKDVSERDRKILDLFESLNWKVINIVNTFEVSPPNKNTFFRMNLGYDFGAYRDAILSIKDCKKLLLINSSMIWSIGSLRTLIETFDQDRIVADVIYLTESIQVERHGQSYFIYLTFPTGNFTVHDLSDFFHKKIRNTKLKRTAVLFGEFGIFKYFTSKNLKIEFVCTYEQLRSAYIESNSHYKEEWVNKLLLKNVPLNPTQHLWWVAYELGLPGIKKTLLVENPAGLALDQIDFLNDLDAR